VKFSFPDASSAAASSKEIQNYQPINAKNKTNKQTKRNKKSSRYLVLSQCLWSDFLAIPFVLVLL
jgi:hypothetical protein